MSSANFRRQLGQLKPMAAVLFSSIFALAQRWRFLVVALCVTTLIYVSYSTPPEELRNKTHQIVQSSPFSTPYTFKGQAISEDAHNVTDADDFLQHFRAVVQYPSMPISDAKAGCGWDERVINLQWSYDETRGSDFEWIIKDEDDFKIELLRKQWQYFVSNEMRPWAKHKHAFKGRGIVIPAGHEKSIQRTKVILRMLHKLNTSLPIEIAYWEGQELPVGTKQELMDLTPLKLYFNDLSNKNLPVPTYYALHQNYHLKIPAVINSRFEEVLLLDSDNIPVIDPEVLFESNTYKEYGTIFWPDIVRTRRQNPIWAITNTRCKTDEWEQESGQLLVDKRRFFYHLQLATWFETEHRSYYGTLILGDKDMFRFAWHALKTKFGVPSRWVTTVGTLSPGETPEDEWVFCGHSFAQHHPDPAGKVAFLHGGLLKTIHNEVMEWQLEAAGGIFQAYKRSNIDENKDLNPSIQIGWDPANFLQPKPDNFITAWCSDITTEEPRPLDEIVPGFQQTYKDIGGYWMLDQITEEE